MSMILNAMSSGAFAQGRMSYLGNEPCGKGGMVPSDGIVFPQATVTNLSVSAGFSGDNFWKLADTNICQLWFRASGAATDIATLTNNAIDFTVTGKLNGCTIPGVEGLPLEELLPDLDGRRQPLLLGFANGSNNITFTITYSGSGITFTAPVELRAVVLASAFGCALPVAFTERVERGEQCACSRTTSKTAPNGMQTGAHQLLG